MINYSANINAMYAQQKTNIEQIDEEHKELIEIISGLYSICFMEHDHNRIERFLKYLNNSVKKHIITEEKYMQQCNCPDIESHRKDHQNFCNMLNEMESLYKENRNAEVIIKYIENKIANWLAIHIETNDMNLAKCIKKQ